MTSPSSPAPSADWVHDDGAWWLLASRCGGCGNHAFPAVGYCHACGDDGPLPVMRIAPRGRVYASTRIYAAPVEFPTPYRLAYVDLAAGPRVLGRLPDSEARGDGTADANTVSGGGDTPGIGEEVLGTPVTVGTTGSGEPIEALLFERQGGMTA